MIAKFQLSFDSAGRAAFWLACSWKAGLSRALHQPQ